MLSILSILLFQLKVSQFQIFLLFTSETHFEVFEFGVKIYCFDTFEKIYLILKVWI